MPQTTDGENEEEAKTDSQQGVKDWLYADAVYDVNEKAETE
jgi:hypothetical protein